MRATFLIYALVFGLFAGPPAGAATSENKLGRRNEEMQSLYLSSYLRVSGSRLVTVKGQEVLLRGVNLGGWLVMEAWMCGFTDSEDVKGVARSGGVAGRSTLESLEDRFGEADAAALEKVWQDNWITAHDLDQIRDAGFNLVRVPFSYRTLQRADGSWILNTQGQVDFKRMDWIVREAASRGIYTIFDLHVWPDQRADYEKIGRPEGEQIRRSMAQLWTVVAEHYRDNGAIAAFDLINEFPGNWGVHQVMSHAISQGDPNRVQVVEGYTFAEFLKLREGGEFPNSVFSQHLYGEAALTTEQITTRLQETANSPVPVYIGEFLAADFTAATQVMNRSNVSWSPWTYKTVDMGDWGAFNYYPSLRIDVQHDSYRSIAEKWASELTAWRSSSKTINYYLNERNVRNALLPQHLAG